MNSCRDRQSGIALVAVLFFIILLISLLGAYAALTQMELASTRYSKDGVTGFYAAEAGLNLRASDIRNIFVGYNRPSGSSPVTNKPCLGGDNGSGDFVCQSRSFGSHSVVSYVEEDPANPIITTIPPGERYQNLNAQEYRYTVRSIARGVENQVEAILELRFKSRLVPLFQFVAFYDKDLEILPGPTMNLSGPIHTNGDLYMDTNAALNIAGQVTTAGDLYRGRKNNSTCQSNPVTIPDPANPLAVLPSCSSRTLIADSNPWNGMLQTGVQAVTVPAPDLLDASASSIYFSSADLRLVLELNAANQPDFGNSVTGVVVRDSSGNLDSAQTNSLHTCTGSISGRVANFESSMYSNREANFIELLDIDMQALLNCLHTTNWLGTGKLLDDTSDGGIVFHFSVDGPHNLVLPNTYGVRVRNATELQSNISGAPLVQGMTAVSDVAFYTHGHYNSTNKIPAAILADAFNVLSSNWNDTNSQNWSARGAVNTTIHAAVLAGTDVTGGAEGSGGQNLGMYNGGLENYPRFHENWSGRTLTYLGSFVSLGTPNHSDGAWSYGNPQYTAPNRNWDYDTDFNDADNLPPLTPRFVYLRQELFVRDFEQ